MTSPVTGTVVRWRITQFAGGPFSLRVLTPVSGSTYTGAGTSVPQTPSSTDTQTYSTDLPIRAGQVIGFDNTHSSDQFGFQFISANDIYWVPRLGDGQTQAGIGPSSGVEYGFNADVQPLPSVSSLSPSSGSPAGGTTVTITGQNFLGTTAVSFGNTPARSFTVLSDNAIKAVTPAMSPGTVDVTVKNPGQSPTVAADRFIFVNCVVPKLKGKTRKAARNALKKAHCSLGKVKPKGTKTGKVKKQKPKAGTVLPAGSKVNIKLG